MRAKAKDNPTPSERTEKYYAARPCPELCRYAADLLDEYLKNKKAEERCSDLKLVPANS